MSKLLFKNCEFLINISISRKMNNESHEQDSVSTNCYTKDENIENIAPNNSPSCQFSQNRNYCFQNHDDRIRHNSINSQSRELDCNFLMRGKKNSCILANITNYMDDAHNHRDDIIEGQPFEDGGRDIKYRTLTEGFKSEEYFKRPPIVFLSPRLHSKKSKRDQEEKGDGSSSDLQFSSKMKCTTQKKISRSIEIQEDYKSASKDQTLEHTLDSNFHKNTSLIPSGIKKEDSSRREASLKHLEVQVVAQTEREPEKAHNVYYYPFKKVIKKKDKFQLVNKTDSNIRSTEFNESSPFLDSGREKTTASRNKEMPQEEGNTFSNLESEIAFEALSRAKANEIYELKKRNLEQQNINSTLQNELLDLKKQIYMMKEENRLYNKDKKGQSDSIAQIKEEYESRILSLEREKLDLTHNICSLKEELSDIRKQYQGKLKSYTEVITSLQDEIQLLQASNRRVSGANSVHMEKKQSEIGFYDRRATSRKRSTLR